ncbi:hypothetical protein P0D88_47445 [Paraburkholderia sp. RL18-103-BIB-C]|uniref:hypothetical protein n=1 Tax=unclassified Paraburkholderia TaxID=2615204 RepID=UPI0038B80082
MLKQRLAFMLPLVILAALSGCSSIQSSVGSGEHVMLREQAPFVVQVRTPSPGLSAIVYELAVQELGKSLDIAERGPGKGVIEVMFSSRDDNAFLGSSTSSSTAQTYGSGWYTGNTVYGSASTTSVANTVSSGATFTWQNSTILVVVRDKEGRRLYTADYDYKGGWELSGWVVNTPEEAARLCIQRVRKQMAKDGVI